MSCFCPATQYTAESFAEPIRRVYGVFAFRASARVDLPAPGDLRPARMHVETHDLVWEYLYQPIVRAVEFLAVRLNATAIPDHSPISRASSSARWWRFCWCSRHGADRRSGHPGLQMLLVLLLAPLLPASCAR